MESDAFTLPSTMPFDFADCEDFLARLEAEDLSSGSYSAHSLSPEDILSSAHGSSPLSSFSPEEPSDGPNNWNADAYLFPMDGAGVSPHVKPETAMDPGQLFFEPTGPAPAQYAVPDLDFLNAPAKEYTQYPQLTLNDGSFLGSAPEAYGRQAAAPSVPQTVAQTVPQTVPQAAAAPAPAVRRPAPRDAPVAPAATAAKGGKIVKPKKTAHNMIEKRYRTNLNDKISALRDCVPSLRCAVGGSFEDEDEELDGLTPASKLNKATVLTKATEYILHLQQKNLQLLKENKALREGTMLSDQQAAPAAGRGAGARNAMGKVMMGSMAGMMVVNAFNDVDGNTHGLAALPLPAALTAWGRAAAAHAPLATPHVAYAFGLAKVLLFLGALAYVFSPGLFDGAAKGKKAAFAAGRSTAMPLEVRQKAFLTATQTVSLPAGSLAEEAGAVAKKAAKLLTCWVVGLDGWRVLTKSSVDDEIMRTAAWRTAIDAQLGGGDQACSHARLLVTLMASFLMPRTPLRSMLQALHVTVLLHDLPVLHGLRDRLREWFWQDARALAGAPAAAEMDAAMGDDGLPEHLQALLERDDVFDDETCALAYGMTWHAGHKAGADDDGLQPAEDPAVKSPLAAVAAWYAARRLHEVLLATLAHEPADASLEAALRVAPPESIVHRRALVVRAFLRGEDNAAYTKDVLDLFREDLSLLGRKPRADDAFADDFSDVDEVVGAAPAARQAGSDSDDDFYAAQTEVLAPGVVSLLRSADCKVAVRCALILTLRPQRPYAAAKLFAGLRTTAAGDLRLLGFTALLVTLRRMETVKTGERATEELIGRARVWIGGDEGERAGLSTNARRAVVAECVKMGMRLGGYPDEDDVPDEGYATGES
ncbi:uncharacterized protein V1510DRAFT_422846 [Dipodascopsis tothii]|uniref:uncharacterized protein n=1 Tax=Dipodascopsis tothii TaxID=44089 RepID=UPI0034CEF8BA